MNPDILFYVTESVSTLDDENQFKIYTVGLEYRLYFT